MATYLSQTKYLQGSSIKNNSEEKIISFINGGSDVALSCGANDGSRN